VSVVTDENCELARLSFAELEEELACLAAHIYAGTCRWLELVAEVDRRNKLVGCTCAQWLAWRCGLTPRTAHVRIARSLGGLPAIRSAFARGQLSFAKVRALTRVADPANEAGLVELALELTAAQLERALRAYRRVTTEEAAAVQEAAYLDWYWDDDGSLVVRGRLAPEDGAVLLEALEAGHAALRRAVPRNRGRRAPRHSRRSPSLPSQDGINQAATDIRSSCTSTRRRSQALRAAASSPRGRRSRRKPPGGLPAMPPWSS